MRKRKLSKKHSVKVNMQVIELTKAGSSMDFELYASKQRIGRIVIGRGSFTWYGKNKIKGKRISWSRFAELMDEHFYPE